MAEVMRRSAFGDKPVEQVVAPTVTRRPELAVVPTARPEPTVEERIGAYIIPAEDGSYYVHEGLLSGQALQQPTTTPTESTTVLRRRVTEEYEISGNGTVLPGQVLSLFSGSPSGQLIRQGNGQPARLASLTQESTQASPNRLKLKDLTASRMGRLGIKMVVAGLVVGAAGYLPYKFISEIGTVGGGYEATIGNYIGDITGPVGDFIADRLPSNQEVPSNE